MCVQSVCCRRQSLEAFLHLPSSVEATSVSKVAAEGRQGRVSNIKPFRVNARQVPGEQ